MGPRYYSCGFGNRVDLNLISGNHKRMRMMVGLIEGTAGGRSLFHAHSRRERPASLYKDAIGPFFARAVKRLSIVPARRSALLSVTLAAR